MNSQMGPWPTTMAVFFSSTLIIAVFINCNSYYCNELCVVIPQISAVIVFGYKKNQFSVDEMGPIL